MMAGFSHFIEVINNVGAVQTILVYPSIRLSHLDFVDLPLLFCS